jgi:sodium-dependent dicarboxylate transporter 2/3/5
VLILFGGGLALAGAAEADGVAVYSGTIAEGLSAWLALLATIAIMAFMSEVTSNTAQVATMVPLLAAIAPVLGLPPAMPPIPATLGASCAFMMPVGTPPNAIVFGTGLVRIPRMMRAGLWLNLSGILLIFALSWWGLPPLLAITRGG